MVDQDAFERLCLGGTSLFTVGDTDRAVLCRSVAAWHYFWLHHHGPVGLFFADLDETHTAASHDRERGVPAVMRDKDPALQRRLNYIQLFIADINRFIVD